MDIFVIQLAIVFLPGLIWAHIDTKYASKEAPSHAGMLLKSFMFGLSTYAFLYLLYALFGKQFSVIPLDGTQSGLIIDAFVDEIATSLPLSLLLSILWLYGSRNKLFARFLQAIGATKKYGDEDVWDFTLNSSSVSVEYAHVRDFDKQLVFAGWVQTFSQSGSLRELVLTDVQVFRFESAEVLYKVPRLYLARSPEDIHIEFPYDRGVQSSLEPEDGLDP